MSEAAEKLWYYNKAGTVEKPGPFTDEELTRLIWQGILTGEDYIWMMDLDEWLKVGDSIYSIYLEKPEQESR